MLSGPESLATDVERSVAILSCLFLLVYFYGEILHLCCWLIKVTAALAGTEGSHLLCFTKWWQISNVLFIVSPYDFWNTRILTNSLWWLPKCHQYLMMMLLGHKLNGRLHVALVIVCSCTGLARSPFLCYKSWLVPVWRGSLTVLIFGLLAIC